MMQQHRTRFSLMCDLDDLASMITNYVFLTFPHNKAFATMRWTLCYRSKMIGFVRFSPRMC